ncbi:MAG TPA: hypothetical protein PL155_03395 [Candidatus Omnitrophota bacterium]|nr:hypothetical protein [Candidatus Omnitrophota bacterium]HPD84477.1 hypothetical protein [Candidatus Omnitrophota bacterium]HRZ03335.1 hypothetical protein [Candidatus Omnitrophota bacterium]
MEKIPEKRRYVRLNSVFPVEYNAVRKDNGIILCDWQQGFTCNVGKGGICLSVNNIGDDLKKCLNTPDVIFALKIRIPLYGPPIAAQAKMVWVREAEGAIPAKYFIGLEFISVAPNDVHRMLMHTRWVKFTSQTAGILAVIFLLAVAASGIVNFKLRAENKALVENLVTTQQKENQAAKILSDIDREKSMLSAQIQDSVSRIDDLRRQLDDAQKQIEEKSRQTTTLNKQLDIYAKRVADLNSQIVEISVQKSPMEVQYAALIEKENIIADELSLLAQKKEGLQKTVIQKMYRWLKNHQGSSTGLVLSFEGDVGIVKDWAFIYDQALAVNSFLMFNDIQGAQKILNFFVRKAGNNFEGFSNAYYFDSGNIAEFSVHCGPNIWVGIAAMQYAAQTKDSQYLSLAEKIADWLITVQEQDPAGGLRGGPKFSWFATEHNLDAYAFFGMLQQWTGKEKYSLAQKKVLNWLKTYSMTPHSSDYRIPPVKRGRGDATIATDTFAWSLAALGPEKLVELDMSPEEIMRFAEEHCGVTVEFTRPSGATVAVNGFDFAKHAHMPRGGIVSPEWTSQMIISYQILGDYFLKKGNLAQAGLYKEKAKMYLDELNKLIISSPSPKGQGEGCLPYATLQDADTGHGWRTPYGTDTGSIAGTAYMMMAIEGYNPLALRIKSN